MVFLGHTSAGMQSPAGTQFPGDMNVAPGIVAAWTSVEAVYGTNAGLGAIFWGQRKPGFADRKSQKFQSVQVPILLFLLITH